MNKNASSKLAVVTGGSSGIGKAISKKLSSCGVKVAIADLVAPPNEEQNVYFRKCDVRKADELQVFYQWVTEKFGVPDYLILNAGQGIHEKLTEGDPEKWERVLLTNLMGPLRFIRAFTPGMIEKKEAKVVFVSSVSANQPHPYGGIYAASKTALEVIAETLRLETLPHLGVTVISPGIVETSFFENQISGNNRIEDLNMGSIPAEEIAEDVWYALSKKQGTAINKIITRPTLQNF